MITNSKIKKLTRVLKGMRKEAVRESLGYKQYKSKNRRFIYSLFPNTPAPKIN